MRLTTWIFGIPLALVAVWIALANRAPVIVSLDPFSQDSPAISLEMPLYLLLFAAVLIGVLLGGFAIGFRRVARRGAELADAASVRAATLLPQRLRKPKSPPQ
ncbi:MAG TPA: LapA family protein [Rhizomicrobium sp.]|nr:LapA family protein [Rhizomicrobium sp.]